MKRFFSVLKINLALLLLLSMMAGCGSGGLTDPPAPAPSPDGPAAPASLELLVSSPQLNSDGASPVTITALVKDSQNRAIADQTVAFAASSGILTGLSAVTDENGMATAQLGTSGDPSSRIINLTATASGISAMNTVAVTGTNISIDPPSFSLSYNDPAGKQLAISLKNSAGGAIAGKAVSIVSATKNSTFLPPGPYTTDNSGQVTITVKNATDTISDTITASAIGVSSQAMLTVNTAKLTVQTPDADTQIPIKTEQQFTVTYTENDAAVIGKTIYFTTTRGTLIPSSAVTNASGTATISVSSTNSGPAVLTAYTTGTPQASAQVSVIFVAKTATKMDLSANPAIINTNAAGQTSEQSLIKAIVRDDKDNLVMGKTVNFNIIQDASAGWLSKGAAATDMYGMATTNYVAGGAPSGLNNVIIRATLQEAPSVTRTTTLTVGNQALFISLATGPEIVKVDPNKYQKDYLALVTDAAGSPVTGAVITATVTPIYYRKGYYDNSNGKSWVQINTLATALSTDPIDRACTNEDGLTHNPLYDYNGVLDTGEDQNRNSRLEPGNVASVTAAATDSTGHSTVSIVYARDYAYWVRVKLEVRASLYGSTTSAVQYFDLPGAAPDYSSITVSPPGNPSPFGSNASCYAALTVLRLSDTEIALRWEPSADAVSYNIYRYPYGTRIASTTTNTSYVDKPVAAATTYCYEIKQVDASGAEKPLSEYGNQVCVAPLSGGLVPPTGVTAAALSDTQIQLSWGDAGAAAYRIYQDGVPLSPDSVTRTVVIPGLAANTRYCFAVSSLDSAGNESAQSGTVCATTRLAAPTGLTVDPPDDPLVKTQLIVRWNPSTGAATYNIYRNGAFRYSVAATSVQVVDTGLAANTQYCYSISAVDSSGNESPQSESKCGVTNP